MKSKNRLLSLLLVFVLAFSLVGTAFAEEGIVPVSVDYTGKLVIIHTNDVHGRAIADSRVLGYSMVKAAKEYYEAAGADVLLLDAGDTLHGQPIAGINRGADIVEILNAVGYDAMTPGNHDFNYGTDRLLELVEDMEFPLLAANFVDEDGEAAFGDYVIFEKGDRKVAVIGLATPETAYKSSPKNTVEAGYNFSPETIAEVLQANIDAAKAEGADYIVCLGHLGIEPAVETDEDGVPMPWTSVEVIGATSGLNLFIDGHSHTTLASLEEKELDTVKDKDGNTVVLTSTGTQLANIGVVVIDSEATTAAVMDKELITADEDITALCDAKYQAIKPELDVIKGNTEIEKLAGGSNVGRYGETNLGNLIADALRAASGADVAFTNGGGIRADLPVDHTDTENEKNYIEGAEKGDITYGDIYNVLPFGNTIGTLEVTGEVLLEVIEFGTGLYPAVHAGFPQISGVTFELHPYLEEGRVQNVMVGDEPLDLEKVYTLTTNDFIAIGGDNYTMLKGKSFIRDDGAMDEALATYIAENLEGVVGEEYAAPQGRMTVIPFADVKIADWFYNDVMFVYKNNIMGGTGTGFEPGTLLNRATITTMLWRLAGEPEAEKAATEYFDDVDADAWYSAAAAWAFESGLTTGTGEKTFEPLKVLSRQEMATFIYRYAEISELVPEGEDWKQELAFGDSDSIADWAVDGAVFCASLEIINGIGGNFSPAEASSRAQGATVLSRLLQNVA